MLQFPAKLLEQYLEVTASREIQQGDLGRMLEVDPGGGIVVLTLPALFGRGFFCQVRQIGEGSVLFVAGPGATLQGVSGLAFRGVATLDNRTGSDWYVNAALTAVPVETVWEVDWTAEPPQDFLTGNGTVPDAWVVGGIPFYTRNSVGCSQFEIVDGVGLSIQTASAITRTFDSGDGNSAPAAYFDVSDVHPSDFNKPWTLWFHQSAIGFSASNITLFTGLWATEIVTNAGVVDGGGYRATGGGLPIQNAAIRGTTVGASALINPVANVMAVSYVGQNSLEVYAGQWNGDWPELSAMACCGRVSPLDAQEVSGVAFPRRIDSRITVALSCTSAAQANITLAHQRMVVG